MNRFYPMRVMEVRAETREAVVLTLAPPTDAAATLFGFHPGQHLNVRAVIDTEEVRRSYSICSAPGAPLQIAIKRVPGGVFSNWANEQIRVGDTLEAMPPSGHFGLSPNWSGQFPQGPGHVVLMSAGSGVTPLLSMATTLLAQFPEVRITWVIGNRSSSSVMFRDALGDLKDRYLGRLNLVHVLSREHQDLDLLNGRLDESRCRELLQQWLSVDDVDAVFLCGPLGMMTAAQAAWVAAGLDASKIHQELFATSLPRGPRVAQRPVVGAGYTQVTVVQDGRRHQFSMLKNKLSLLDAALAESLELPYSCKGGVCSTCRCKVTEGDVEMDTNYALEDYEIARGFRLTCQSFPLTDQLTIDFDQET